MLLIGYFQGIDSQRDVAWRCADSRSPQELLALLPTETNPEHSSLTRVRKRLPLEANADMKAIVRRDPGSSWKDYVRSLSRG